MSNFYTTLATGGTKITQILHPLLITNNGGTYATGVGLMNSNSSTSYPTRIDFYNKSLTGSYWTIINNNDGATTNINDLRILSNAGGTTVMTMLQNGNVGIGTVTISNPFEIWSSTTNIATFSTSAITLNQTTPTLNLTTLGTIYSSATIYGNLTQVKTNTATNLEVAGAIEIANGTVVLPTSNVGYNNAGLHLKNRNSLFFDYSGSDSPFLPVIQFGAPSLSISAGATKVATFSSSGLTINAGTTNGTDNGLTINAGTSPAKLMIVPANSEGGSPMIRFYPITSNQITEFSHSTTANTNWGNSFNLYTTASTFKIAVAGLIAPVATFSSSGLTMPGTLTFGSAPNENYVNIPVPVSSNNGITFKIPGDSRTRGMAVIYNGPGSDANSDGRFQISSGASNPSRATFYAYMDLNALNTGFSYGSDIRLKKNITTNTDNKLNTICNLHVVNYNYNSDDEDKPSNLGFIAQEVKKIIPEAISLGGDDMLNIHITVFIPYLVKAVQELSTKVASQETTINVLQQQVITLMQQMETLLASKTN